jgi:hypothetical protein
MAAANTAPGRVAPGFAIWPPPVRFRVAAMRDALEFDSQLMESLAPAAIAAQGVAVARHLAPFGGQPNHNKGILH